MPPSILDVESAVAMLSAGERDRFERLFEVSTGFGRLAVPASFEATVGGWYRGDDSLASGLARAREQPIVRARNRVTGEETLFNPLRARRPVRAETAPSIDEWVDAARDGCDFCVPLERTTRDTWGRVESLHALTAANAAKYDAHHGLVVFREHHPLRFGRAEVVDYFATAHEWLERHREFYGALPHAMLAWNCLERSGASQRHGHLHVVASDVGGYGRQAALAAAAARYREENEVDYWADWLAAHRALGLAATTGDVELAASLTPIKGHEVILVGRDPAPALAAVLRALIDRLGMLSFNVAAYLPRPGDDAAPTIVRAVGRGDPRWRSGDMGAMELFATPVVASDPFATIAAVRAELEAT